MSPLLDQRELHRELAHLRGEYRQLRLEFDRLQRIDRADVAERSEGLKVARRTIPAASVENDDPSPTSSRFRYREIMERAARSLRLDVGRLDDLRPLFGIIGYKLAELSGRTRR